MSVEEGEILRALNRLEEEVVVLRSELSRQEQETRACRRDALKLFELMTSHAGRLLMAIGAHEQCFHREETQGCCSSLDSLHPRQGVSRG